MSQAARILYVATLSCLLLGCSGSGEPVISGAGSDGTANCDGRCTNASSALSVAEVEAILLRGVREARAQGSLATLAVVDRLGNVLGVYRMGAAAERVVRISSSADGGAGVTAGLEGVSLPVDNNGLNLDHQAAIAKALTGAYLSSEGNAFSSRTASQIVQEHFNPGEDFQPGGPLFGVQFSQLACSDFMLANPVSSSGPGPQRSPLGLAADPGGFPLYKGGAVVGGVGVMADGIYGVDKRLTDLDQDVDELIALAASQGFAAPLDRRADRITVEGKTLRFSDARVSDLRSTASSAITLASLPTGTGALIAVSGYFDGNLRAGRAFSQPGSGILPAAAFGLLDAFEFVDAGDVPRYPLRAGSADPDLGGAAPLSTAEVEALLSSALSVAARARAQIRRPLGSSARVTVAVVDTQGEILGMLRSRDAPVFGADVSLQKARTAAFFSSARAASVLQSLPDAAYLSGAQVGSRVDIGDYVQAARQFLGDGSALANGAVAFSDRAGGNLSRPFFPDGINGRGPGPFSKAVGQWSVFSTGLQLDIAINAILQHVLSVASGGSLPDVGAGCAGVALANNLSASVSAAPRRLANGIQIFPGSVPIYRGEVLLGGIGVSGDGVDQDDMIAFLAVDRAGQRTGGALNNAPLAMRADNFQPQGTRLRYVQCPQSPYLDSADDNVCAAK